MQIQWICSRLPIVQKVPWIYFRERAGSKDIHPILSSQAMWSVLS